LSVQSPLGETGDVDFRISFAHLPRRKPFRPIRGGLSLSEPLLQTFFQGPRIGFLGRRGTGISAIEVRARSFRRKAPTDPDKPIGAHATIIARPATMRCRKPEAPSVAPIVPKPERRAPDPAQRNSAWQPR